MNEEQQAIAAAWERMWEVAEENLRAEEDGQGGPHVDQHYGRMVAFARRHDANHELLVPAVVRQVVRLGDPLDPGPLLYEAVACVTHATRWAKIRDATETVSSQVPRELESALEWIRSSFRDDWDGRRVYEIFDSDRA